MTTIHQALRAYLGRRKVPQAPVEATTRATMKLVERMYQRPGTGVEYVEDQAALQRAIKLRLLKVRHGRVYPTRPFRIGA